MNSPINHNLFQTLAVILMLATAPVVASSKSNDITPVLTQVPTYNEQAIAAKLLANAVNKQESLDNQQNVLTLRQLEAQNKHTSELLEQEKLALERDKLALEQMRLTQQQKEQEQHSQRMTRAQQTKSKDKLKPKLYQQVDEVRLVSILTSSSGQLKAIFYHGQQRATYLEGDQIFLGAQLIKVAANGVAIKLNEEVIFKYIN